MGLAAGSRRAAARADRPAPPLPDRINPLEPWPGEPCLDAAARHEVKVLTRLVDYGGLFWGAPDRWPLSDDLAAVGTRWGIDPGRDLVATH